MMCRVKRRRSGLVWIYLSMTVQHSSGSTLAMAREQEADTGSLAGPLSGQRA